MLLACEELRNNVVLGLHRACLVPQRVVVLRLPVNLNDFLELHLLQQLLLLLLLFSNLNSFLNLKPLLDLLSLRIQKLRLLCDRVINNLASKVCAFAKVTCFNFGSSGLFRCFLSFNDFEALFKEIFFNNFGFGLFGFLELNLFF